jgi:3-hydroxyacyl-[acyl-carrier-protein] dehydratase
MSSTADVSAAEASITLPLEIEDIERLLPHRYPFLLIDRVIELEPHGRIVALKNVSANEPHFTGHFPGQKIMPGVLIIEALAQAAAVMHLALPENRGQIVYLTGVDNAKIRRPVVPGDTLRLEAKLEKMRGRHGVVSGRALVGDQLAASVEIKFAAGDAAEG